MPYGVVLARPQKVPEPTVDQRIPTHSSNALSPLLCKTSSKYTSLVILARSPCCLHYSMGPTGPRIPGRVSACGDRAVSNLCGPLVNATSDE